MAQNYPPYPRYPYGHGSPPPPRRPGDAIAAVLLAAVGLALVLLPWGLGWWRDLESERRARIRSEAAPTAVTIDGASATLFPSRDAWSAAPEGAYYDAAALMLAGKPFKKAACIAKMIASEAAMDNARDATQVFGGYGFMNEYPVARHYRDSKILEIGEGTTEVQLMLIAREAGL